MYGSLTSNVGYSAKWIQLTTDETELTEIIKDSSGQHVFDEYGNIADTVLGTFLIFQMVLY